MLSTYCVYILCIVYVMKEICPVRHPKLCALKKIDPASAGRVLGNELNTQILGLSRVDHVA